MSLATTKRATARASASFSENEARTRATAVYDDLHSDLLDCKFAPGEKLLFRILMKRYHTGISTIREALLRLVGVGLVQMEEQRGFFVTPASREDLLELVRLRQQIEAFSLRSSIANATDESDGDILKSYYRFSKLQGVPEFGQLNKDELDATFAREFEIRHSEFHRTLVARCDMPRLLQFREILFEQGSRYRRLKDARHRVSKTTYGNHRALMEAVLERNTELACRLMNEHIMRTAELLLADPKLRKLLGSPGRLEIQRAARPDNLPHRRKGRLGPRGSSEISKIV